MSRFGFTSQPSYAGAPDYSVVVPCAPFTITTAVTTGVAQGIVTISNSLVANYSRFSNLFDEARIVSASFELIPLGINTGVTAFFFSEVNLGTPTLLEAEERRARLLKNNEQSLTNVKMSWTNSDFTDASWSVSTSSPGYAYFCYYTDNANYGSPATVQSIYIVRASYKMQFRGLKSA
jgi:hypothetical protein